MILLASIALLSAPPPAQGTCTWPAGEGTASRTPSFALKYGIRSTAARWGVSQVSESRNKAAEAAAVALYEGHAAQVEAAAEALATEALEKNHDAWTVRLAKKLI